MKSTHIFTQVISIFDSKGMQTPEVLDIVFFASKISLSKHFLMQMISIFDGEGMRTRSLSTTL